jgi:hypothetical protein
MASSAKCCRPSSEGGVDQLGDYGTKPRGKTMGKTALYPPWGTHSTPAWSPISANPSPSRGRGRPGSVPDSGQIGDGDGMGTGSRVSDSEPSCSRARAVRAATLVDSESRASCDVREACEDCGKAEGGQAARRFSSASKRLRGLRRLKVVPTPPCCKAGNFFASCCKLRSSWARMAR